MEVKKITEGMTAPQVAQVIDDNFKGIIGETDAKLTALGSYKSYNYTKDDYVNSLIKEIHIEGVKDESLIYFVRSCTRKYSLTPGYAYFAIQSYNQETSERKVVCDFLGVIDKSGVYEQTLNGYKTTIYVTLENQKEDSVGFSARDYSEDKQINDICWGGLENAPLIKSAIDLNEVKSFVLTDEKSNVEVQYELTDGYWNGNNGITPSDGFRCTKELIDVCTNCKIIFDNFINNKMPESLAVAYLYDENKKAIGLRINKDALVLESENVYSLTIKDINARYIGVCTTSANPQKIYLEIPFGVAKIFKDVVNTELTNELNELKDMVGYRNNHVDLIMFMGQSNMAGRGTASQAPKVLDGVAYEFRAISDKTKLYPILEPFGVNENKEGGINEPGEKTGSLVSSFVNSYTKTTGKVVVGVSASKGGTNISQWQNDGILLPDAVQRFRDAVSYLETNGYTIDKKYMVWLQGESDGDRNLSSEEYKSLFLSMFEVMKSEGIEVCHLIRIGQLNTSDTDKYSEIISAQTELCKENDDVVMASTALTSFREKGLMKDAFHYYQQGYNLIGKYAGRNVGLYRMYGVEKPQYDSMTGEMYYSDKCY